MSGFPKFDDDQHVLIRKDVDDPCAGHHFCVTDSEWSGYADGWIYYGFSLDNGAWLVLEEHELQELQKG